MYIKVMILLPLFQIFNRFQLWFIVFWNLWLPWGLCS